MRSVRYDKLVRDKIPDVIRRAGKQPVIDTIPSDEMAAALDRKLQEETREYLESRSVEETLALVEQAFGLAGRA